MRSLHAALLLVGSAALLGLACGGPPEVQPNVLLIVLDTLRADHLSCYGYGRSTTPTLDRLAERATRWEQAFATAPWTLPSHASIFTGLLPFEHGAHTELTSRGGTTVRPLGQGARTLAEELRDRGYRTGALVANTIFLAKRMQLDQGFEHYSAKRSRAAGLNRAALEWLDGLEQGPFFLFLNYMDVHRPYDSRAREGFLPEDPGQDSAELLDALYGPVLSGQLEPTDPRLARLIDQYDTALANLDEALGELFAELDARGLFEDTLIVVTSDHGEYFGEHALIEHSKDVYVEGLRVPLIFKAPGQTQGQVVPRPLSLAELPARIVEHLDPRSRAALDGRFLRDLPVLGENYYSRSKDLQDERYAERFRRIRRAWLDRGLLLIDTSVGPRELYDLAADPAQLIDLAPAEAERTAQLAEALERLIRSGGRAIDAEAIRDWTPAELEQQRDFGY